MILTRNLIEISISSKNYFLRLGEIFPQVVFYDKTSPKYDEELIINILYDITGKVVGMQPENIVNVHLMLSKTHFPD